MPTIVGSEHFPHQIIIVHAWGKWTHFRNLANLMAYALSQICEDFEGKKKLEIQIPYIIEHTQPDPCAPSEHTILCFSPLPLSLYLPWPSNTLFAHFFLFYVLCGIIYWLHSDILFHFNGPYFAVRSTLFHISNYIYTQCIVWHRPNIVQITKIAVFILQK